MGISCGVQVQVRKLHPTVMSDNPPEPNLGPSDRQRGVQGSAAWTTGAGSVWKGGSWAVGEGPEGKEPPARAPVDTEERRLLSTGPGEQGAPYTARHCQVHMQEQHQKVSRASIICSPVKSLSLMLSSFLRPLEKVHPLKNGNSTTKFMYSLPLGKRYSKPWKISRPNPKQSPQRERTFSLIP